MCTYNQVERRMAPLGKALTGLLPHETNGIDLYSSRKTIDSDLEKRNFNVTGEILVKVWEEVVLDKFPIVAEYLEKSTKDSVEVGEKWGTAHCKISQYLPQIIKCADLPCCGNFRSTWKLIFPGRFLPAPVPVRQTPYGPIVPSVKDVKSSHRFANLCKGISFNQLIPKLKFKEVLYLLPKYCCM